MKKAVILMLLAMLVSLAACTPTVPDEPITDTPAKPSEPIPPSPEHSPPGEHGEELLAKELLVHGNSAFAFDLYQELRKEEGNLFYSPYSISTALAMTYAGARGETAEQMAGALNFDFGLPDERMHSAFSSLDEEIAERGKGREMMVVQPEGDPVKENIEGFRLNIVNALWGQEGYDFLSDYLNLVEKYYGGGLRTLDFINEPEPSRITINDWVSEQTEDRINDLIQPGGITPLTRLVLTNAIYFNAAWEHKFTEEATTDLPFYLLDGDSVTVPMMRQTETFGYTEGDNYQAVEMPYDGKDLSMVVLLPAEGKFTEFEDSLDYKQADRIIDSLNDRRVKLTMPKFEFESDFSLKQALSALGMADAFSGGADFSGMTGNNDLFIGDVVHKAFVLVEEGGTEAAAATAVIMVASAPGPQPEEPVTVTIDRPFVFLIRDIETGAILFIGRVINPAL